MQSYASVWNSSQSYSPRLTIFEKDWLPFQLSPIYYSRKFWPFMYTGSKVYFKLLRPLVIQFWLIWNTCYENMIHKNQFSVVVFLRGNRDFPLGVLVTLVFVFLLTGLVVNFLGLFSLLSEVYKKKTPHWNLEYFFLFFFPFLNSKNF